MQCYECSEAITDGDATVGIVGRDETFCCSACVGQFIKRLALPSETPVFVDQDGEWPLGVEPEPSPLTIAVIGVSNPGREPAVKITTREQYLEYFLGAPERELKVMFDSPAVLFIPVQTAPQVAVASLAAEPDPVKLLPCPCARCGKEATLLHAFQNKAGHIFCGFDCYKAGGET